MNCSNFSLFLATVYTLYFMLLWFSKGMRELLIEFKNMNDIKRWSNFMRTRHIIVQCKHLYLLHKRIKRTEIWLKTVAAAVAMTMKTTTTTTTEWQLQWLFCNLLVQHIKENPQYFFLNQTKKVIKIHGFLFSMNCLRSEKFNFTFVNGPNRVFIPPIVNRDCIVLYCENLLNFYFISEFFFYYPFYATIKFWYVRQIER